MNRPPAPSRRLDWILFGLRWLLTLSALAALLTLHEAIGNVTVTPIIQIVAIITVFYDLIIGILIVLDFSDRLLRPLTLIGDVLIALLFFGTSALSPLVMVGVSLFPIITASLRYGRIIGLLTTGVTGTLVLGIAVLEGESIAQFPSLMIGLLFLFLTALLTGLVSAFKANDLKLRPASVDERAIESNRLRVTRERARSIYEMASTLGATLDYSKVLDAALDLGTLGLREINTDNRLIGVVLVFRERELHVATSRRLTRQDEKVIVPGQRGVLGLALKQSAPVFAADAHHDPELQYFSGLAVARSLLAIPLRAGFDNYGVLLFGSETPDAFSDEHVELLNAIGTQATIALQNAVLYQNLRQEKERIVDIEEDARKKLARDLHDGPTQNVAAIAMRVNYIRTLLERRPEDVGDELYKVEELARRTTKEIRHMLFTLRPLVLETQGLSPAFKQLAEKMKETHNLDVIVEAQSGVDVLIDARAQGVLFYIVEEAVNNARKHAKAEHIYVRVYRQQEYAVIEVQDDGVGFDLSAVDANYEKRGSLGMINMRERAELAEGTLHIDSAPGQGTRISILVLARADLNASIMPPTTSNPTARPAAAERGENGKNQLRSPAK